MFEALNWEVEDDGSFPAYTSDNSFEMLLACGGLPSSRCKGSVRKTRLVQKNAEVPFRLSVNSDNVQIGGVLRNEFLQVEISESWGTDGHCLE